MRRASAGAGLVLLGMFLTGCRSDVTSARLERSLATTFDNLLALQQARLDHPDVTADAVNASASCFRRTPTGPKSGAGDDWRCTVEYPASGGTGIARFDIQAKTDGCYRADGAPVDVGRVTLTNERTGKQIDNPLFEFDGCYDVSWGAR